VTSIRAAGPKGVSTLKLIERLNLQNQVIPSSRNALRNRYLWLDGRLQALPSGPLGLAFSSVGRKIVRAALSEITVAKRDAQTEDETIESFFARRFGPEFARTLGDALVHGIYAGHANRLSMQSCFPQLWEYEKKYGSVVKGFIREAMSGKSDKQAKTVLKRPKDIDGAFDLSNNAHQYLTLFMDKMRKHRVYSFAQGIDTLTNSLAAQLKSNLVIGSRVVSIRAATSSQAAADKRHPANLLIELEDGRSVAVDNVVSALPAYALAGAVSHIPELQQLLMNIPFVSVAVVHLAYKVRQAIWYQRQLNTNAPLELARTEVGWLRTSRAF
jgi:oxygen-dependent protoporphyrinogen oxidase